ncbi:MAG: hypothetical protein IJU47_02095 [Verrucomicrobia bacterium]|nr:hypothetical protein [Verrucomicrobiota bacterium]
MNETMTKYTQNQSDMLSILKSAHRTGPMTQEERDAWDRLFDELEDRRAAREKKQSAAERFNAWHKECLRMLLKDSQQKVSLAAASRDEKDTWIRQGNFDKSFHLENREEDIQVDIDCVDQETLEVIIKSNAKEKYKALEILDEDGTRTELGKIEENSYAKINLVKLHGKLVITTEENKMIELKVK